MDEVDLNDPDDETIVLRMMDGDQAAVRLLIETHGGKVRAALWKRFRDVIAEPELDEAMNCAAFNVYRFACRFDKYKGTLRGWFLSIAIHAVRDIIRREERHRHKDLEYDPEYNPAADDGEDTGSTGRTGSRQIRDIQTAIATVLSPGEKQVIMEDLAAGTDGLADAGRLAEKFGCSKNQIYVWRSKAKQKIEQFMIKQGHFQNTQGGKR